MQIKLADRLWRCNPRLGLWKVLYVAVWTAEMFGRGHSHFTTISMHLHKATAETKKKKKLQDSNLRTVVTQANTTAIFSEKEGVSTIRKTTLCQPTMRHRLLYKVCLKSSVNGIRKQQKTRFKQTKFIGLQNNRHPSQHTFGNVRKPSGNCQQRPL